MTDPGRLRGELEVNSSSASGAGPAGIVRFGAFELDLGRGELYRQGRPVALQELPLRLLVLLVQQSGQTVQRDEIFPCLWPGGLVVDYEHGLNTVVRKLRRALGDSPARPRFVETVPREGYRFVAHLLDDEGDLAPSDDRADAAAVLARIPFVGRRQELAELVARARAAGAGQGSFVLVSGEPGVGKTRLLEELAERAPAAGLYVFWGRCVEGEGALPYAPFGEALAEWVRAADLTEVRERLGEHAPVLARLAPVIRGRLPELGEPLPSGAGDEGPRMAQAIAEIVAAAARHQPLLLILDDLQWADPATSAMLARLVRLAAGLPLLIVAGRRPDPAAPDPPAGARIELGGFDRAHMHTLLELLSGGEVPPAYVDAFHRETGGNPFFMREILLHLAECGELVRDGSGQWVALREVEAIDLPASIRAVVERRLARLSEDARRLLVVACSFAGSFDFPIAAAAARLDESDALDALDEICEAQLVQEADVADRFEFSQALVRSVLYTGLNPARRARIHRRVALALTRERGRALSAGEIARHWRRSAELPGAEAGVEACLAAAGAAERIGAWAETARWLRTALSLAPTGDARRPAIESRLGLALARAGKPGEAARVAAQAGDRLARADGPEAAASYLADVADAIWWVSLDAAAWTLAEQGLRFAGARRDLVWARLLSHALSGREAHDPELPGVTRDGPERRELTRVVLAHPSALDLARPTELWRHLVLPSRAEILERVPGVASLIGFQAGGYRAALAEFRTAAETALRRHHRLLAALLLASAARLESALGALADADASQARAEELAREGPASSLVALRLGTLVGDLAQVRGEGFEALGPAVEAALATDAPETRWVLPLASAGAASVHAMAGREREALAALVLPRKALAIAPGWSFPYVATLHRTIATLWTLGRAEGLEPLEALLRERALAPDFRHPHTDARLSLARLCGLGGRTGEALGWFDEARRVLDEQGALPLRALCDYDEALLHLRAGSPRPRVAELRERALARFDAVGMPGWRKRAEALLG